MSEADTNKYVIKQYPNGGMMGQKCVFAQAEKYMKISNLLIDKILITKSFGCKTLCKLQNLKNVIL